ncbi:stonin-2-like, partial [Dendronephthya gigantea]|uniref:stonin-2-like n=1 Tax=Dendronephthya gigantea TaxID=151771 RepID=UPI00106CE411
MNYRTIQHREDELLLANSSKDKGKEDLVEKSSKSDDDATRVAEKEKLINNIESEHATFHKDQPKSAKSGDTNQNTSYLSSDLSQIRDPYASAASNKWISFDETSTSQNIEYTKSEVPAPEQNASTANNSILGPLFSESDWVRFESTRGNDAIGTIHTTSSRDDTVSHASREIATHESEGNLGLQDTTTNPFSNSELDRISSFSKLPKNSNGIPIKSTLSSNETSGDPNGTHVVNNGDVDRATSGESDEDVLNSPLPAYPVKTTSTSWSMLLRYPDTKRRIRGREWRPVIVKLSGSILQVYNEHDPSGPFREVSLQCFYDLTKPKLQQYQRNKMHTIKIVYVKYKETNKLISKKNVQYIARTTPILKIASPNHTVIQEFTEVVRHAMRSLPIFRDRGISHNTEAVYINVHDTCTALIDATGSVLMLGILVRIYLRAFISGDAECELVLNDIHMKSKEETRLRDELMPQRVHKWIKLEECDFHSTVNSGIYNQNRSIMLHPLDSCTFEVMQFRVRPVKPLPLLAKCEMVIDTHGRVELHAEVKLCSDPKLARYERKNICLYFAIPDAWMQLFMKENRFWGEKSITSTNSQKAIKMRNRKNRPLTTIEVSTGSARYEPEYRSIVWRIDSLPLLNTTAPADSTHDFLCHIQTMDSSGLPET